MADFVPNQGEEEMNNVLLGKIPQPALFLGLMQNTPANVNSLGELMQWSNIVQATGFVGANEQAVLAANWTVPTGAQSGNPATHPQVEFTADVGGASNVSGYYIRSANNRLWAVGLSAEVEVSGVLRTMLAGARYRVNPSVGAT